MEHASARRPIELPFLDVIGELGNPYWKVRPPDLAGVF